MLFNFVDPSNATQTITGVALPARDGWTAKAAALALVPMALLTMAWARAGGGRDWSAQLVGGFLQGACAAMRLVMAKGELSEQASPLSKEAKVALGTISSICLGAAAGIQLVARVRIPVVMFPNNKLGAITAIWQSSFLGWLLGTVLVPLASGRAREGLTHLAFPNSSSAYDAIASTGAVAEVSAKTRSLAWILLVQIIVASVSLAFQILCYHADPDPDSAAAPGENKKSDVESEADLYSDVSKPLLSDEQAPTIETAWPPPRRASADSCCSCSGGEQLMLLRAGSAALIFGVALALQPAQGKTMQAFGLHFDETCWLDFNFVFAGMIGAFLAAGLVSSSLSKSLKAKIVPGLLLGLCGAAIIALAVARELIARPPVISQLVAVRAVGSLMFFAGLSSLGAWIIGLDGILGGSLVPAKMAISVAITSVLFAVAVATLISEISSATNAFIACAGVAGSAFAFFCVGLCCTG